MHKKKQFQPLLHVTLVQQITEFLTHAIVDGDIKSGDRIIERELERQFGVSRAPIRESLRILEKNGLVINLPRKGTFVRKISKNDIEENFLIRALLESLAGRLALRHLGSKEIQKMETVLAKMEKAVEEDDFRSYLKFHNEFHEIFIRASKSRALIDILSDLRQMAAWFKIHMQGYTIRVHREILQLFKERDPEKVEALIKEHIMVALQRFLITYLSKKDNDSEHRAIKA